MEQKFKNATIASPFVNPYVKPPGEPEAMIMTAETPIAIAY